MLTGTEPSKWLVGRPVYEDSSIENNPMRMNLSSSKKHWKFRNRRKQNLDSRRRKNERKRETVSFS